MKDFRICDNALELLAQRNKYPLNLKVDCEIIGNYGWLSLYVDRINKRYYTMCHVCGEEIKNQPYIVENAYAHGEMHLKEYGVLAFL